MKRIAIIAEYMLSFPGGGEESMYRELLILGRKYKVNSYTFDNLYRKGKEKHKGITYENFGLKYNFKVSRFIEISVNRKFIMERLEHIKPSLQECAYIITQSLIAPIVAEFCNANGLRYHYYIRDEHHLNIFENYEEGPRKILKAAKSIIEFPSITRYKKENVLALKNADRIVANSKFLHDLLKKKYGLKSEIKEPEIDKERLRKKKLKQQEQKYITFIGGGNAMKGFDIVLKIARKMQDKKFLIVGPYNSKKVEGNITFMPWQKDVLQIYRKTRILLVPSRWNESFGRVVAEANLLGIPVITSNRGGLGHTNKNKNLIINELEDIGKWTKKIASKL